MNDRILQAVGAFLSLPVEFFGLLGHLAVNPFKIFAALRHAVNPFEPLALVWLVGAIAFVLGILIMLWRRQWTLWSFLIPVAVCQVLVTVSGFMRGDIRTGMPAWLFFAFCTVQLLLIGYLVYRERERPMAAIFLAIFCVAYSLMASFLATMFFSNTFL